MSVVKIDKDGNPKVAVLLCSSATCTGSEIGCSAGDCLSSGHHSKNRRWRWWTMDRFRQTFEREPR